MSDALSDISRDEDRDSARRSFWRAAAEYLIALRIGSPGVASLAAAASEAADAVDSVSGGFFGSRTHLRRRWDEWLPGLLDNTLAAWGVVLLRVKSHAGLLYDKLKEVSPFAGKMLVVVDYGTSRRAFIEGDVQEFIDAAVRSRGFRAHDGDDYLIPLVLPDPETVVWLGDKTGNGRTDPFTDDERKRRLNVDVVSLLKEPARP